LPRARRSLPRSPRRIPGLRQGLPASWTKVSALPGKGSEVPDGGAGMPARSFAFRKIEVGFIRRCLGSPGTSFPGSHYKADLLAPAPPAPTLSKDTTLGKPCPGLGEGHSSGSPNRRSTSGRSSFRQKT
jgi:hypothetical protein